MAALRFFVRKRSSGISAYVDGLVDEDLKKVKRFV